MDREYIREEPSLPGKAASLWLDTVPATDHAPLSGVHETDVCVVGGGLAGVMTAVLLRKAGKRVALVEARRLGGGATGHTTAKVTVQHELIYRRLTDTLGEHAALIYAEANLTGLNRIAQLVGEHGIDCDFHRLPFYMFAESERDAEDLHHEAAVTGGYGLPCSFEPEPEIPFRTYGALRVDAQAQFHPIRFLLGLLGAVEGDGLAVFEESRVTSIEDASPCRVLTKAGEVRAQHVVVATHFPIHDKAGYFARLFPYMAYAAAVRLGEETAPVMAHNVPSPDFGVRSFPGPGDPLLVVSGQSHKTGHGGDERAHYRRLEIGAHDRFGHGPVEYHWSTEDYSTADGMPFVGFSPSSRRVLLATGFGGWGMTNCSAAAILMTDLITTGESPWREPFDPGRIRTAGWQEFVKENAKVARSAIGGYLSGPPERSPHDLRPGEGAVVKWDGTRYAAFREPGGQLTTLDPKCTHMGCTIEFNEAEKTWDCPCHGSRFDSSGRPVDGPAQKRLKRLGPPAEE